MASVAFHGNKRSVKLPITVGIIAVSADLITTLTSTIMSDPVSEAIQSVVTVLVDAHESDFTTEVTSLVPRVTASSRFATIPVVHVQMQVAQVVAARTSFDSIQTISVSVIQTEVKMSVRIRAIE